MFRRDSGLRRFALITDGSFMVELVFWSRVRPGPWNGLLFQFIGTVVPELPPILSEFCGLLRALLNRIFGSFGTFRKSPQFFGALS